MNTSASQLLEKLASDGKLPAIIEKGTLYSYQQLIEKVAEIEQQPDVQAICPGSVVLLLSDYTFEAIAFFLALFKKRAIIVPVTSVNPQEIAERVNISGAEFLFDLRVKTSRHIQNPVSYTLLEQLKGSGKAGLILFSSGSSGKPKAMVHDLDNLAGSYVSRKSKSLVFIVFLMFDHIGGLNTLLNCLTMGATMVIPDSRNPDVIAALIEKHRVNVLPASPTFLNLMLISKCYETHDLSSLRMITYGTEPMPEGLLVNLKRAFPKTRFLQTFGTSETGIIKTSSKSSESTLMKFDDPDQEFKIVNGELWIRSQARIKGYLNYSMDSFTEDGWFKTGDLAEEASDGFVKIKGRIKEVINVGGEKVLPAEVESVVMEVEGIVDCIAYGLANSITGEVVALNIVVAENTEAAELKALVKKHCSEKLERYKIPVKINVVENIGFSERFKKKRN